MNDPSIDDELSRQERQRHYTRRLQIDHNLLRVCIESVTRDVSQYRISTNAQQLTEEFHKLDKSLVRLRKIAHAIEHHLVKLSDAVFFADPGRETERDREIAAQIEREIEGGEAPLT